jgi:SAM-dependent methyltransferase
MTPTDTSVPCGACGQTALVPLFTGSDRNQGMVTRTFTIARCAGCGVVQTTPPPDNGEREVMYPVQYYPGVIDRNSNRAAQLDKIALVRSHKTAGRLLDIGAGVGLFVRHALDNGFDAHGVEMSAQAVATGTRSLDVPLTCGDFLSAPLPPASFDVVTLWHVLEHLDDPRAILVKIRQILNPDGVVVIAVPNFDSMQARLFRGAWYHLDVPRHLFHYTPASLANILAGAGFRIVDTRFGWGEHDPAGFLGSVMRLSPPGEGLVHRAVRKLLGNPAARVLARCESALHKGGTFAIVATPH